MGEFKLTGIAVAGVMESTRTTCRRGGPVSRTRARSARVSPPPLLMLCTMGPNSRTPKQRQRGTRYCGGKENALLHHERSIREKEVRKGSDNLPNFRGERKTKKKASTAQPVSRRRERRRRACSGTRRNKSSREPGISMNALYVAHACRTTAYTSGTRASDQSG